MSRTRSFSLSVLAAIIALSSSTLVAQETSPTRGPGGGRGPRAVEQRADSEIFRFLLDARDKIDRQVEKLPDGVRTETTSQDADVTKKIQEHVRAMHERLKEGRPIHARDPLFAEIFRNADKIRMEIEPIDGGVRVRETSADPYVAKLLQAHAEVVTQFLKNGHEEVRKNHAVPERD